MSGPSYEVFIDVRSHKRHNEDNERVDSTCFKWGETGDPDQLIADSLRDFAARIAPEQGDKRSEFDILAALNKVRARWIVMNDTPRTTIIAALNSVAKNLGMEWYGFGVDG
jgi:hypothetical protein